MDGSTEPEIDCGGTTHSSEWASSGTFCLSLESGRLNDPSILEIVFVVPSGTTPRSYMSVDAHGIHLVQDNAQGKTVQPIPLEQVRLFYLLGSV